MKAIALLPICFFILGCASDRQPPKVVSSASGSEVAIPIVSLQDFVSPETQAAIQQLHVGMSEFEVFKIMMPVSRTWSRHPSYTDPGSAELYFGIGSTQELSLHLSSWKVASIGPFVPAKPPTVVYPALGNFN